MDASFGLIDFLLVGWGNALPAPLLSEALVGLSLSAMRVRVGFGFIQNKKTM
jgi:hypothetical protein